MSDPRTLPKCTHHQPGLSTLRMGKPSSCVIVFQGGLTEAAARSPPGSFGMTAGMVRWRSELDDQ